MTFRVWCLYSYFVLVFTVYVTFNLYLEVRSQKNCSPIGLTTAKEGTEGRGPLNPDILEKMVNLASVVGTNFSFPPMEAL
jgi:hypothetical protein